MKISRRAQLIPKDMKYADAYFITPLRLDLTDYNELEKRASAQK